MNDRAYYKKLWKDGKLTDEQYDNILYNLEEYDRENQAEGQAYL